MNVALSSSSSSLSLHDLTTVTHWKHAGCIYGCTCERLRETTRNRDDVNSDSNADPKREKTAAAIGNRWPAARPCERTSVSRVLVNICFLPATAALFAAHHTLRLQSYPWPISAPLCNAAYSGSYPFPPPISTRRALVKIAIVTRTIHTEAQPRMAASYTREHITINTCQ